MRITRFAAVLSLALAAAPTLMAATRPTPDTNASSNESMAVATKLPANMSLRASLHAPVTFHRAPLTFTATVNGASDISTTQMGFWYSVVSGGTPPYSYFWLLDEKGLNLPPTATGYSGYITTTGTHYIYVDVHDANGLRTFSNEFFIHVH